MWFVYSIITLLLWALADLFYKKANNDVDKYSDYIFMFKNNFILFPAYVLFVYKKFNYD